MKFVFHTSLIALIFALGAVELSAFAISQQKEAFRRVHHKKQSFPVPSGVGQNDGPFGVVHGDHTPGSVRISGSPSVIRMLFS